MKKAIVLSAIAFAAAAPLHAQGLYNIMPYDDEPLDMLPLEWVAGLTFGYDDNATPTGSELPGGTKSDTTFAGGFLQANYANVQPQTTLDFWGRVGAQYFFDSIPKGTATAGGSSEDVAWDLGVGLNVTHRVSERLRLRSRNDLTYQVEPDYSTGFGPDRRVGQYFRYSTDNSVGYSWTERFATVTGFRFNGVVYDDINGRDYTDFLLYNEFRYRLSPATVLTGTYRFGKTNNDTGPDSDAHYLLVGAEHKFSPTTVGVIRGGVSFFDRVTSHTAPYVEGMLKVQTNEQLSFRGFIWYRTEDRGSTLSFTNATGLGPDGVTNYTAMYDERNTLRIGTQATYELSPDVALFGGVNVVFTERDSLLGFTASDGGAPPAPGSFNDELVSANLGASYRMMENVFLNGSYIFTTSNSDGLSREYDRNRFNLGIRTTF